MDEWYPEDDERDDYDSEEELIEVFWDADIEYDGMKEREHDDFIQAWFEDHFPPGSDGPYDGWEWDADCAYDEHLAEMARGPFDGDMPDMPEPDAQQDSAGQTSSMGPEDLPF